MADIRRRYCPLPDLAEAFVELPARWYGKHAKRRDEAIEAARKYESETFTQFAVALALAENWNIPGLVGNPAEWDFSLLDLRLIVWVTNEVLLDFNQCWFVPKGLSQPLVSGQTAQPPTITAGS